MGMLVSPYRHASGPVATTYPLKANVKLYTYGKGADGTPLFADHSPNLRSLATVGNAQVDTAIAIDGPAILLDGTGDYITMAHSTDFNVGNATDFCIEAKIQRATATGATETIFSTRGGAGGNNGGFWFGIEATTGKLFLETVTLTDTSAGVAVSSVSLSSGVIYHVAGSREGSTLRVFVDGTLVGTATQSGTSSDPTGGVKSLGYNSHSVNGEYSGSINHVRFTKGQALYTQSFIPPTPPLVHTLGAFPDVTINPSDKYSSLTLGDGHLVINGTEINYRSARATKGIPHTGKGYFEFLNSNNASPRDETVFGIMNGSAPLNSFVGSDTNGWGVYQKNGNKFTNGSGSAYGTAWGNGVLNQCAFNNGSVWFGKDDVWVGDPVAGTGAAFTGITGTIYPAITLGYTAAQGGMRFHNDHITGTKPTGFPAWEDA